MDYLSEKNRWASIFFEALSEEKGVQHIVDRAFELLGNPLLISDLSHKIIAYTQDIDFGDPIWDELIKKGYRSYSLVVDGSLKGLFERIRRSDIPFNTPADELHHPNIYARIKVGGKAIGYISVVGVLKPFEPKDIEIVSLLGKTISQEMQKSKFFRNSGGRLFEYFLTDILDNRIQDADVIDDRTKHLSIDSGSHHYLMVIRGAKNMAFDATRANLQRSDLEVFGRTIFYNDDIVLFFSRKSLLTERNIELKKLAEKLAEYKFTGGLSRSFEELVDIREAYEQAKRALEFGQQIDNNKVIYRYEQYAVYHFISTNSEAEKMRKFYHPSLYVLREYDNKHSTNFCDTLYCYLQNDKKLAETSEILHVHRNTLHNRIERIREIMKVDLDNSDLSFHLLLSYKIKIFLDSTQDNGNTMIDRSWEGKKKKGQL